MPLPLTVSCFTKIQIGFTFLVLAHPGSPGQRAIKRVCDQVDCRSYSRALDDASKNVSQLSQCGAVLLETESETLSEDEDHLMQWEYPEKKSFSQL